MPRANETKNARNLKVAIHSWLRTMNHLETSKGKSPCSAHKAAKRLKRAVVPPERPTAPAVIPASKAPTLKLTQGEPIKILGEPKITIGGISIEASGVEFTPKSAEVECYVPDAGFEVGQIVRFNNKPGQFAVGRPLPGKPGTYPVYKITEE